MLILVFLSCYIHIIIIMHIYGTYYTVENLTMAKLRLHFSWFELISSASVFYLLAFKLWCHKNLKLVFICLVLLRLITPFLSTGTNNASKTIWAVFKHFNIAFWCTKITLITFLLLLLVSKTLLHKIKIQDISHALAYFSFLKHFGRQQTGNVSMIHLMKN